MHYHNNDTLQWKYLWLEQVEQSKLHYNL